ncbi:hypothetical protein D6764_00505 [Candidatus Woesearchaeota archaeon]|nr:MAG: hypothetical protein D6764_00505 [Candidatus Woesearchaeota archaeon]
MNPGFYCGKLQTGSYSTARSPSLDIIIAGYSNNIASYRTGLYNYDDSRPMNPSRILIKFGDYYSAQAKSIDELVSMARKVETAEERVRNYFSRGISREFLEEASRRGYRIRPVAGVGVYGENSSELPASVAAAQIDLGTILFSEKFNSHIREMAKSIGVDESYMRDYVISHELGHLLLGIKDEQENEKFLEGLYTSLAEKSKGKKREAYLKLAAYARERYYKVPELYRREGSGEATKTAAFRTKGKKKKSRGKKR